MTITTSSYPLTIDSVTGRQTVVEDSNRHTSHLATMGAIIKGELPMLPDLGVTVLSVIDDPAAEELMLLVKRIIIEDVLRHKSDIVIDTENTGVYEVEDEDSGKALSFVLVFYPKDDPQQTTVALGSTEQGTAYLNSE